MYQLVYKTLWQTAVLCSANCFAVIIGVLRHVLFRLQQIPYCNRRLIVRFPVVCTVQPSLLGKGKGKAVPIQSWSGPEGSRKLRFPDFMTTAQDGGKVVSLTHRPPFPPWNTPGTHFCSRLSRPQGHSATGRIMSLKNSSDTIGKRTRDLPVCSVVP